MPRGPHLVLALAAYNLPVYTDSATNTSGTNASSTSTHRHALMAVRIGSIWGGFVDPLSCSRRTG